MKGDERTLHANALPAPHTAGSVGPPLCAVLAYNLATVYFQSTAMFFNKNYKHLRTLEYSFDLSWWLGNSTDIASLPPGTEKDEVHTNTTQVYSNIE